MNCPRCNEKQSPEGKFLAVLGVPVEVPIKLYFFKFTLKARFDVFYCSVCNYVAVQNIRFE